MRGVCGGGGSESARKRGTDTRHITDITENMMEERESGRESVPNSRRDARSHSGSEGFKGLGAQATVRATAAKARLKETPPLPLQQTLFRRHLRACPRVSTGRTAQ